MAATDIMTRGHPRIIALHAGPERKGGQSEDRKTISAPCVFAASRVRFSQVATNPPTPSDSGARHDESCHPAGFGDTSSAL